MPSQRAALFACFLLAAPVLAPGQTPPASKAERIDRLVAQYQKYGYFNGAILVADHGKVIYSQGVGKASFEYDIPNTPSTKFGIASITKQFTALLVLQQIGENKIALQGKVSDYLPWYRKDTGARMTIEQLLHHTSGLPSDFDSPEFNATPEAARRYEHQEFAEEILPAGAYFGAGHQVGVQQLRLQPARLNPRARHRNLFQRASA